MCIRDRHHRVEEDATKVKNMKATFTNSITFAKYTGLKNVYTGTLAVSVYSIKGAQKNYISDRY